MRQGNRTIIVDDDWGDANQPQEEEKPKVSARVMQEARRQVDLEEAVRWERSNRGISADGIDDWKRRDIIVGYFILTVVVALVVYFAVR